MPGNLVTLNYWEPCLRLEYFEPEPYTPLLVCFVTACMAIVDEVTWEISQIDPRKTIQVGSFRIDSQGNQKLREVGVFCALALLV